METSNKLDLSALQDGKLHLIAFLGDKFCYLVEDPDGSEWALYEAFSNKFPMLVRRMLADRRAPFRIAED